MSFLINDKRVKFILYFIGFILFILFVLPIISILSEIIFKLGNILGSFIRNFGVC